MYISLIMPYKAQVEIPTNTHFHQIFTHYVGSICVSVLLKNDSALCPDQVNLSLIFFTKGDCTEDYIEKTGEVCIGLIKPIKEGGMRRDDGFSQSIFLKF